MITVSIVTFRQTLQELYSLTERILKSNVEKLYLIDNSPNDALRVIEKTSDRIRYIHNANIGYGGAHNLAIREAMELGSDYHAVVNPDIVFETGVLEALAVYMDAHSDAGWVMPKVEYPDGELQYLCKLLPSPADLILRRFFPASVGMRARDRFEMRDSGYDRQMNVPFLSGCFMFLRVDALRKVGLFDERFFMYGEDIDLSRRMHAVYKTMYYPEVSIVHAHERASFKNRKMLRVHIANIVRYFNKWGWFFDRERRRVNAEAVRSYLQSR